MEMKFFEFKDYEYYALIGALSKEEAIKYYEDTICETDNEDSEPVEIPESEAREKLLNACKDEEEQALELDFFNTNLENPEPYLILVDDDLF